MVLEPIVSSFQKEELESGSGTLSLWPCPQVGNFSGYYGVYISDFSKPAKSEPDEPWATGKVSWNVD